MKTPETDSLSLFTPSLKDLLRLFEPDALVERLQLGDTNAPFSGFIDESIFPGTVTVEKILQFGYGFKGLVLFTANIGDVHIRFTGNKNGTSEEFSISGPFKKIIRLRQRIIERAALEPWKYKIL